MSRVIVIVEGSTEEKFLKTIVFPYFHNKGFDIRVSILPSKIIASGKRYKGGDVRHKKVIDYVKNLLHSGIVTTLFDYYGINNDFAGYQESLDLVDIRDKKKCIENALSKEINNPDFIPYIQMYEFEGLLFSNIDSFSWIEDNQEKLDKLKSETNIFETPEHINNNKETAPSKRIEKIYPGYGKTTDGILIAEDIGLSTILEKCPLFREWINKIEESLRM